MKKIKFRNVIIAFIIIVAFVTCVTMQFLDKLFVIPTILCVILYGIVDKFCLRCPSCGKFVNINDLMRAKKHIVHCIHCGDIIEIE